MSENFRLFHNVQNFILCNYTGFTRTGLALALSIELLHSSVLSNFVVDAEDASHALLSYLEVISLTVRCPFTVHGNLGLK